MTGYRSGFAAGDDAIVGLARVRPTVAQRRKGSSSARRSSPGVTSGTSRKRAPCRAKRLVLPVLEAKGLRVAAAVEDPLWVEVEGGSEAFAERLLAPGVVVSPKSFFGPSGGGYIRFALVPSLEDCRGPPRCWGGL